MTAWSELLRELREMPGELERATRLVPADRLGFKPRSWGGAPGETFSVLEHVCHLRDIERDGYQVRVQRLLDEDDPCLASLDGYEMARERRYEAADLQTVLREFREARGATLDRLATVEDAELTRSGEFAEYGRLTLHALVHYLRSHDQQHLAGIHWLAGKIRAAAVDGSLELEQEPGA